MNSYGNCDNNYCGDNRYNNGDLNLDDIVHDNTKISDQYEESKQTHHC